MLSWAARVGSLECRVGWRGFKTGKEYVTDWMWWCFGKCVFFFKIIRQLSVSYEITMLVVTTIGMVKMRLMTMMVILMTMMMTIMMMMTMMMTVMMTMTMMMTMMMQEEQWANKLLCARFCQRWLWWILYHDGARSGGEHGGGAHGSDDDHDIDQLSKVVHVTVRIRTRMKIVLMVALWCLRFLYWRFWYHEVGFDINSAANDIICMQGWLRL